MEKFRRKKGRLYIRQHRFRGCYAPARLHEAPYPLGTAKCLRSFYQSTPRRTLRNLLTPPFLRRKIPRGVHSIIRYLCRDDDIAHNRRKKKVSIEQENTPWSWRHSSLSGSHLFLLLVRNRSFAPPRPQIDR